MDAQRNRATGITLIELLIVLSIIAVLSAMATPALGNLMHASASRSMRSALLVAINQARSTAAMRQQQVVVCPSADQDVCDRDLHWHHGWLVFIDKNRNGEHEADEEIIVLGQAPSTGVAILGSRGRHRIRYQPDGTADGSNLTLTFCDRRGADSARTLVMNNSGRLRGGVPSASQSTAACAAIGS